MRLWTKILILSSLSVLVLTGCRPRGVLSSRQMQEVLYDLHRADAVLNVAGYVQGGYETEVKDCYRSVLDKHGITQAQFDSSLVWYTNHPALFDKIYPKLETRAQEEEDYWTAREEREKQRTAVRDGFWRQTLPDGMQPALWNTGDSCAVVLPPAEASDFGDFGIKMRIFVKKVKNNLRN